MDIKSNIEEMSVKQEWIRVLIVPRDAERLIGILRDLLKRAKPDKFEQTLVGDLIEALEQPNKMERKIAVEGDRATIIEQPIIVSQGTESPYPKIAEQGIDKKKIIENMKDYIERADKTKKTMEVFIKESIDYAVATYGIKIYPANRTPGGFYDWLYENRIINADGSPNPDRK